MRPFKADLHIHSCLSPCAELDMSPKRIVQRCLEVGLQIIAICDHNSAENVEAAIRAGNIGGIVVLPGMEINTKEEVHILGIFENAEQALSMQESVYRSLEGFNKPEVFGEQIVVNEFDEVDGFNQRLLIGPVNKGVSEVVNEIRKLGGMAIASHVDRPSFSILGQLGFIPQNLELDAIEVVDRNKLESLRFQLGSKQNLPVIISSDAHQLEQIGIRFTEFWVEAPSFQELRKAVVGRDGRKVVA